MHTGFRWGRLRERALGKPRHRCEGNINMDIQEVGCEDMDWIDVSQNRDRWRPLVNAIMNLRVSYKGEGGYFLSS